MKKLPLITGLLFLVVLLPSCLKEMEEHYGDYEATVDMNLLDVLSGKPEFSVFMQYLYENGMDTIFEADQPLTLFIPDNEAFSSYVDSGGQTPQVLKYHISPTVFLTNNIYEGRKLETLTKKFVLLEPGPNGFVYDGITIEDMSPLYLDGKYYELSQVAYPRLNIYEYATQYSSVIKDYIDLQDSLYLDQDESIPIGFDDEGNTIYDTTMAVINRFERDYFAVSQEFRNKSATFILFTTEQYQEALNLMAENLGGVYHSYEDIPSNWQFDVLFPYILDKSVFEGMLEYNMLQNDTLINICGDTVLNQPENIDPGSRYLCSNGLVYNYLNFEVPLSLYQEEYRLEGESLVDSLGAGNFAWKDFVSINGAIIAPDMPMAPSASEEYLVNVQFDRNYNGDYTIEFPLDNVFPARYRLVWQANYRPSGLFAVYVNDTQVGTYDNYNLRRTVLSVTGEAFIPDNGFNRKDFWVDNITEYGTVNIRFEYLGSGEASNNGFNLDYISLIPE